MPSRTGNNMVPFAFASLLLALATPAMANEASDGLRHVGGKVGWVEMTGADASDYPGELPADVDLLEDSFVYVGGPIGYATVSGQANAEWPQTLSTETTDARFHYVGGRVGHVLRFTDREGTS